MIDAGECLIQQHPLRASEGLAIDECAETSPFAVMRWNKLNVQRPVVAGVRSLPHGEEILHAVATSGVSRDNRRACLRRRARASENRCAADFAAESRVADIRMRSLANTQTLGRMFYSVTNGGRDNLARVERRDDVNSRGDREEAMWV